MRTLERGEHVWYEWMYVGTVMRQRGNVVDVITRDGQPEVWERWALHVKDPLSEPVDE